MARYVYQTIDLSRLSAEFPYRCRYRAEVPELLADSILKQGIMQPLIVSGDAKPVLISGHRRLQVLHKAGVKTAEVLALQQKEAAADLFLLSVYSNWCGSLTDLDKAFILHRALKEFLFSKQDAAAQIFPAFHPVPDFHFMEEACELFALAPQLLDQIAEERLPFRGSRFLNCFSHQDQIQFAALASQAALSSNQLQKTAEWIFDLMRLKSFDFSGVLKAAGWDKISASSADRKNKGERLYESIGQIRFPKLRERMAQFESAAAQFGGKSGVTLEAPAYLEAPGYTLKAKIKDAQSLEHLRKLLDDKRKVLNSLLDIVL